MGTERRAHPGLDFTNYIADLGKVISQSNWQNCTLVSSLSEGMQEGAGAGLRAIRTYR